MFLLLTTQILEAVVHVYLLKVNQTHRFGSCNLSSTRLYGGLMAGIFEETGRYFSFKWFLKKQNESKMESVMGLDMGE